MKILLTGSVDKYGHVLIYILCGNQSMPEKCDKTPLHTQLKPYFHIMKTNGYFNGIAFIVDVRETSSIDDLHAVLSSLIICQKELCSDIALCYFLEPNSKSLRKAFYRFVKYGSDDTARKLQSALTIPFQILTFTSLKPLKDHICAEMLIEEFGGSLMFDEVSFLLQITVIDTIEKLKSSINSMHSFIESSSDMLLDGDVFACLDQYSHQREQALSLYSHLKTVRFDRFDPFPLFRKLLNQGDALHSLGNQIQGLLLKRQKNVAAYSLLYSKLEEGLKTLECLENVLQSEENLKMRALLISENSPVNILPFFSNSGPSATAEFLNDFRFALQTAAYINDEEIRKKFCSFDLEDLLAKVDAVESMYTKASESSFSQCETENEPPKGDNPEVATSDILYESPGLDTSSSLSQLSPVTLENKIRGTSPVLCEISPGSNSRPTDAVGNVQIPISETKSPLYRLPVITTKEFPIPANELSNSVTILNSLLVRFENRSAEFGQWHFGNVNKAVTQQAIVAMKDTLERISLKIRLMKEHQAQFTHLVSTSQR